MSILLLVLSILPDLSIDGKFTPELKAQLAVADADQIIEVIVHMREQADLSALSDGTTKTEKLLYLQEFAKSHQDDLLKYLQSLENKVSVNQTWWIFSGLMFTATKNIIETVAARSDVDYVIDNFEVRLETNFNKYPNDTRIRTPEWNISKIMADSCWAAGYTGANIIIGHIDTGMDTSHPALEGNFSGYWFDAVNGQPAPYDDNSHGTHTAGIICGGDGFGPFTDDIGVAPGVLLAVAKAFNASGGASTSDIHAAMQWMAGIPVKAVCNGWGSSSSTSTEFWDDCMNWRNLGIFPIFPIGSSGPNPGTTGTPGNFPINIGSGATNSVDNVASFSSRGPAPNQSPWNDTSYWYRPDWNLTKPDIVAPGVGIRSSIPGGGYQQMGGTSFTSSHIAGAAAILYERDSTLTPEELYNILLENADHPSQGEPYPNNNYGWGRLNVWNALQSIPGVKEQETDIVKKDFLIPTIISGPLHLPQNQKVTVFDILGREVEPPYLAPGIYFIENDKKIIQKIIIMK